MKTSDKMKVAEKRWAARVRIREKGRLASNTAPWALEREAFRAGFRSALRVK